LDRVLVAGLMLEAIMEASPGLPADPQARRRLIQTRLKDSLASNLAGHFTLDKFRVLVRNVDHWVNFYYPLVSGAGPLPEHPAEPGSCQCSPTRRALREDLLANFLEGLTGLLPRRAHRKLEVSKLQAFLHHTQGRWFCLKEFQEFFGVDRKTAWEYVQKLAGAGLLCHNRGRSAAVRYSLAPGFLRVSGLELRQEVARALLHLSPGVVSRVGDCLISTGGEAFWEDECDGCLPPKARREIFTSLKAAALIEVIHQAGQSRLLRLQPCWVKEPC
jgi:hypothetical protein